MLHAAPPSLAWETTVDATERSLSADGSSSRPAAEDEEEHLEDEDMDEACLLYTSPSPRDS